MGSLTEESLFDPLQETEAPTGPPWLLLAGAALCVIASAVLIVGSGPAVSLIGYLLAAVAAVSFVGLFRYVDGRRRGKASYSLSGLPRAASVLILVACWACASAHAWFLATALAR